MGLEFLNLNQNSTRFILDFIVIEYQQLIPNWKMNMVVHLKEKSIGYEGTWKIVRLLKSFIVGPLYCNRLPLTQFHSSVDVLGPFSISKS